MWFVLLVARVPQTRVKEKALNFKHRRRPLWERPHELHFPQAVNKSTVGTLPAPRSAEQTRAVDGVRRVPPRGQLPALNIEADMAGLPFQGASSRGLVLAGGRSEHELVADHGHW